MCVSLQCERAGASPKAKDFFLNISKEEDVTIFTLKTLDEQLVNLLL